MHNNILSVLRYLPYSKEKTFLWLSQGFHLSVSLLMFWCIMQETRYRSLFCHLQLPFSRKLRPPRVFNVRQRNRLRFLKNPSTLHKFCHFEIHLKGSQLLNLVVKIPAFSLSFRDGFHLIASLFTHGITTLNSSIRCLLQVHVGYLRSFHLSTIHGSSLRRSDRHFYELRQMGENIRFVFYLLKTPRCMRALVSVNYKYHRDKLYMCG